VDQSSNKCNHCRPLWLLGSKETMACELCRPALQFIAVVGGERHDVALLRMISPANRGPQRATARRQYIGNCLPQEAMAPAQQGFRPTRQVYEEIQLVGSLHILMGEGSCSPGRFRLTSCHLQHWLRGYCSGSTMGCWSALSLWG
jgi:hypothetical protein